MQILGNSGQTLIWGLVWPESCPVSREVSPRQFYPVIRKNPEPPHAFEVVPMRWGLVPHWCLTREDLEKYSSKTFNARAETAHERPTFRDSFWQRRCLIQIAGFLEWRTIEKCREKHLVVSSTAGPLILAGLWDRACIEGKVLESFTVLTCPPNALLDDVHQRMPVILGQKAARDWLEHQGSPADLLRPCPSHWLEIVPANEGKTPSFDLGED